MAPPCKKKKKKISYPYKVDYNDHFETPLIAYTDILPMLDAVAPRVDDGDGDDDNCHDSDSDSDNDSTDSTNAKLSPKKKKKRRRSKSKKRYQDEDEDEDEDSTRTGARNNNRTRTKHVIYDPYFCNGKTKQLLHSLGFTNVQHEKRDFYRDIQQKSTPNYDTLITNPPYSEDHKEKCIKFAIEQLRSTCTSNQRQNNKFKSEPKCSNNDHLHRGGGKGKPFFILMPNYVACRMYFRSAISIAQNQNNINNTTRKNSNTNTRTNKMNKKRNKYDNDNDNDNDNDPMDIFYVVPSKPYEYIHPEGTGKDYAPFASIWYCGIPLDRVDAVKEAFRRTHGADSVGVSVGSASVPAPTSRLQQGQELPNNFNSTSASSSRRKPKQPKGKAGSASTSTSTPTSTSTSTSTSMSTSVPVSRPPQLVSSLAELKRLNAVPTIKRPNPRQRKKARMAAAKAKDLNLQLQLKPNTTSNTNTNANTNTITMTNTIPKSKLGETMPKQNIQKLQPKSKNKRKKTWKRKRK